MRDKFPADSLRSWSTKGQGIVDCFHLEEGVVAGRDLEVSGRGVSDEGSILQDVNIDVWDAGGVRCWVRDIDLSSKV